jgi:hypothetical protein
VSDDADTGTQMPGGNRRRAWFWAVGGLVIVLVVVLVVVLLTRDDGGSGSAATTTTTSSTTSTSTPPPSTTAVAPTTTAAPTTAAPTTTPPSSTTLPLPPITDDPGSYAQYLFVAWQNGDKSDAGNVASADAVDQLFSRPYDRATQWTFDTCNPAAGSLYCTWNGANQAKLTIIVRTLTGGLPIQVVGVQFE